ncbi:MAG: phosphoglycerate dehydrogenase [Clostridiales Family XIII bacterium]|nr:phosphoglycerate dehydrogenase [Clostridiales Family XIII bacterium]
MKKILITSKSFGHVSEEPLEMLHAAGCETVFYNEAFDEMRFRALLSDCAGLIIGSHKLSKEAVTGAKTLKIVSKHGAGLDNIDLPLMKRLGITVTNVPAVNANAVADLTFGLILDLSRGISAAERNVRAHEWKYFIGADVYAKTLSLIGFGRIAQNVARRAAGFSMRVLVYDPYITEIPEEFLGFAELTSIEDALRNADVVSVHVPLNDSTRDLIAADEFRMMKPLCLIVNTSRGGVINENDLCEALREGRIGGAALDVLENEPVRACEPLLRFDRVIITPHMGMYSFEAVNQVSLIAAQNIIEHLPDLE